MARFGSGDFDMAALLAPAIALAEEGFPVHQMASMQWERSRELLCKMPNGREMLQPGEASAAPKHGEVFRNPGLAQTFRELAAKGKPGFYEGRVADEIVRVLAVRL